MSSALTGFTVIDLTQGLCGPFASMRLGDAGAEIIKIEPLTGDSARTMGPPFIGDESAVFLSLNRNKKSLALDIRKPEGQDIVRRLAAKADVVLEDFGPGEAEKLSLGMPTSGRLTLNWCIAQSARLVKKDHYGTCPVPSWLSKRWQITQTHSAALVNRR